LGAYRHDVDDQFEGLEQALLLVAVRPQAVAEVARINKNLSILRALLVGYGGCDLVRRDDTEDDSGSLEAVSMTRLA
jgi:hypothetical protein